MYGENIDMWALSEGNNGISSVRLSERSANRYRVNNASGEQVNTAIELYSGSTKHELRQRLQNRTETEDIDDEAKDDEPTKEMKLSEPERRLPLGTETPINPVIVDMKTTLGAKGLTSPEQTATGKGISNPLMAVMVCQKPYGIQLTNVSSTEIMPELPQQNGVAERKNKTLIEAARTMLADSFLPNTFWAKAVILKKKLNLLRDYFVLPIWSSYSSTVKRSTAKDAGEAPNKHPDLKTDEKPVDKEDQVFLDELKRLKEAKAGCNDGKAEASLRRSLPRKLRSSFYKSGAAKASSTNIVNTASTPVSTASPYDGLSFTDLTNLDPDDLEIHTLEDIYNNPTDRPIPTSRINSIYPSTLILRDPQSAVQTRSKVTKSSGAYAFDIARGRDQIRLRFFAPCQIEAIRIFLAFASYMGFIVYQMDVKSAFLYGKIDEEVYVSQPPGFIDPKYPKKNGYIRGTIDKTLFIKKQKHDIILVQVYVDDIIFGSTKKSWYDDFEALMKSRFQMSSMGELTFFLGLQVNQKEDGIFISQDKYVAEILKKFDFVSVKTASTPIEIQKPLVKDEEASDVDVHLYRSMIGSLIYLTASRPDIMFAVYACSRFQVTPKTSHLSVVKRIFRYLKGKLKQGLWYHRVSSFDLEAYSDSDYAGENLDRKSTTGGCQFLGRRTYLAMQKADHLWLLYYRGRICC
ncbi:putative ribonuclease H-like domain-containing protein [Tanacetum coccineum]